MRLGRSILCSYVAATLFCVFAAGQSAPQLRRLDVPYVPTTDEAVAAMLKLAEIKPADVVYDLGCGDGRIVIAAAKKFGTRGVGIDIDPIRIREAKENAKIAGVEKLVRFEENDLFKADIHEANVVMLFLLNSVNLKLRPKLLGELKPDRERPIPGGPPVTPISPFINRQALHAAELSFAHPMTAEWHTFSAPLPEDLERAVELVRAI